MVDGVNLVFIDRIKKFSLSGLKDRKSAWLLEKEKGESGGSR